MPVIEITRVQESYGFEAKDENGNIVRMDTSEATGGKNFGARPIQLLLMGLGGCSGIDIISILEKQKQSIESFKAIIEADREEGKIPSLWKNAKISFVLHGKIDKEKAERACTLAMEKYCSVAETLRLSGTEISWELQLNP